MCSDEKHKIGVKIISGELEAPQPFLAKLLQQLNKNGLVTSTKGPYGGFYLSEENKTKTVWDIVLVIDGNERFSQCFLGQIGRASCRERVEIAVLAGLVQTT